jgi:Tfp pilus assembly protein PilN
MKAVNLIPADQRGGTPVGTGRSEGGAYALLVLIAGIAVLALLYGKARHEVSSRSAEATSLTSQAQQAQAAASRLAPYTSFAALREKRMQAVDQLVDSRFDWAHLFHELGRVLPAQTSLTSISGSVGSAASSVVSGKSATPSATVASATPPGSVPTFTVAGCATSQREVALTLERLRLIDGVSNATLQSSTATFVPGGATSPSSSAGNCPASDPVFTIDVTFEALPTLPARTATTVDASTAQAGVR